MGIDIPIVTEEYSRSLNPDVYLVLPWSFGNEFIERETEFLDRGGAFVFPLPTVRIVTKEGSHEL
jgi:NDP-4-keto-2,6-dideoxyhexose 3-C-methyltransferase